jgi:hypothetical protein
MVSRKQRNIDFFKRRQGSKEPRKSILIVSEGSKTEPIYFNSLRNKLRLAMVEVKIVGEGAAPITVVDRAIELRAERKRVAKKILMKAAYDVVYCVIDVEAPKAESLSRAVNKAKGNKLQVILSNPCFEYWYILHFRKTSAPFGTSQETKSALRQEHRAYCESDTTIFDVVYPKTSNAIKNSKEVLREQHNGGDDLSDCNPSTHVHKIVEYLINMAQ